MTVPQPGGREQWVAMARGVRISRRWMTRHTPQLLAAWRDAPSALERRRLAARILQAALQAGHPAHQGGGAVPDTGDGTAADVAEEAAARADARLLRGPDWPPLAAALRRAAAAGFDVAGRLPVLVAAAPLPGRHPARELHWRLLDDCPAALPPSDLPHPTTPPGSPADTPARADPPRAVHIPAGRPPIRADRPDATRRGAASTTTHQQIDQQIEERR